MSRAFVKEDSPGGEQLPDLPISPNRNYVTPMGLAQIDAHLTRLRGQLEDGEEATRPRVERDLRYWRARRASAELVVRRPGAATVQFGSTVTIVRPDGEGQTWRIVGEDEADPMDGTLSYTAPVARALIGKEAGDSVEAGGQSLEIVKIT